jgi:hypothetical protein
MRAAEPRRPATGHTAEMRATADVRSPATGDVGRSAKMRCASATSAEMHSTSTTHRMRGSAATTHRMRGSAAATHGMWGSAAAAHVRTTASATSAGPSRPRIRRPRKSDHHAGNG